MKLLKFYLIEVVSSSLSHFDKTVIVYSFYEDPPIVYSILFIFLSITIDCLLYKLVQHGICNKKMLVIISSSRKSEISIYETMVLTGIKGIYRGVFR